jgi:hypothetical protein
VEDKPPRRLDRAAEADPAVGRPEPLQTDRTGHVGDRRLQRVIEDDPKGACVRVIDDQHDGAHEVGVAQLRHGAQQVLRKARSTTFAGLACAALLGARRLRGSRFAIIGHRVK